MKIFTNTDLVDAFNEGWSEGNEHGKKFAPEPMTKYIHEMEELFKMINQRRKVASIKELRAITNCGLKEAKDLVEKYFDFDY